MTNGFGGKIPADDSGKARDELETSILPIVMANNFCEKMTLTSHEALTVNHVIKKPSHRTFYPTYQPIDLEQNYLTQQQKPPDKAQ